MAKFSLLIFSRNDVEQALDLVTDMYNVTDDIVMIDGSDSSQKKILYKGAKKYRKKLRVFDVPALGYSEPLRPYGHKKCRHEWVLRLDTDERISEQFKHNIRKIISDKGCNAFEIKVHDVAVGKMIKKFDWQIMLYKKSKVYISGLLHTQPSVNGTVKRLTQEDIFIEHRTDMHHTARAEYPKMEEFHRMSYAMYNDAVKKYVSKLVSKPEESGQKAENSMLCRLVLAALRAYEIATFRKMDSELSNFDYTGFYLLRELFTGEREAMKAASAYVERVKKSRSAPDGDEVFEISKIINRVGMVRFLGLDDRKVIDEIAKKYSGRKQGVGLLSELLKKKYEEAKYENIVISPHIDDAFFSLGGLLLDTKDKRQKVVNVFSATDFTIKGRIDQERITRLRRREEMKNAREVGAMVEFLRFEDTESDDFSPKSKTRVLLELRKYLKEGKNVLFPLGIGGHGHHVFLAKIGFELALKEGYWNVCFYEDLPYAIRGTRLFVLIKRLIKTNNAKVFPVIDPRLNPEALTQEYINFNCGDKIMLCKNYSSQVNWSMLAAVKVYARILGHWVSCRERIWRVKNPDKLRGLVY